MRSCSDHGWWRVEDGCMFSDMRVVECVCVSSSIRSLLLHGRFKIKGRTAVAWAVWLQRASRSK